MLSKKKTGRAGGAEAGSPLQSIFTEATALTKRLGLLRRQLHAGDARSLLERGLLHELAQHGPQTVPHLARSRNVSRQHIQTLVNRMASEGQLQFVENPAHQRSSLVQITAAGKALLAAIDRREATHLSELRIDLSEEKLRLAAEVLHKLRQSIGVAPRKASSKSTSSRPRSAAPVRRLTSRKPKNFGPVAPRKTDRPAGPPVVPAATAIDSWPEEFPISLL